MSETIKIRNTDFLQKVVKLDGKDWRFRKRPYIYPIINSNKPRIILLAARQTEKSTSLSGILLANTCLRPNISALYVSPTGKQTGVFSRKKIDEAFEVSPFLKKIYYPGVRGFRIEEKRLKNYSTMYFRSAYHDADSIRGITAKLVLKDEIQDMLSDVIPVIDACAQKQLDARFISSGTAKTFDNPIHLGFEQSNGCEWHIKCEGCGKYNMLGIDLVQLDRPGIYCIKCGHKLESYKGVWVAARQGMDVDGYRLPCIILPEEEVNWKDLYFKMRTYDEGALMNEVFGVSFDNGTKPVTRDQLIAACHPERPMWATIPNGMSGYDYYAGIDWGGGNTGFTILTIGYFDGGSNKFKIVFSKRYLGREASPENVTLSIAKTLMDFHVQFVGADLGFGWGTNDKMRTLLPTNVTYVTYRHAMIKRFIAYDEQQETYVTNRTEVMTDLFNAIKTDRVEFYKWAEYEDIGKDILNISAEYSDALRQIRYVHQQPDDACHSALYARLTWMLKAGVVPSTRYRREDDEPDARIWEQD